MDFKKFLGVISVFVVFMFVLMLVSSYAWYSFSNGNTFFNTETLNDVIDIDYNTGRYININDGIPVLCDDIDDSNNVGRNSFSININGKSNTRDVMVAIELVDISIDKDLLSQDFRYELLYNNHVVSNGNFKDFKGDTLIIVDNLLLNGTRKNDFELRVYILDSDKDQNDMMNKMFKGTISVNVVSRNDSSSDFKISSIKVDGKDSKSIPTKGDYEVHSNRCNNMIKWDNSTKTISIKASDKGIPKSCDLEFNKVKSTKVKLASVVKTGDYVAYSKGKGVSSCPSNGDRKFYTTGYRVAYVDGDSVYLVSSSAVSCMATSSDGNINNHNLNSYDTSNGLINHLTNLNQFVVNSYCDSKYVSLGKCNSNSVWAMNSNDFSKIVGKDAFNCFEKSSDMKCGYNNDLIDNGGYYWIATNFGNNTLYYWDPVRRYVSGANSSLAYGVRAIIKLDKEVYITGGVGTKKDAYKIGI